MTGDSRPELVAGGPVSLDGFWQQDDRSWKPFHADIWDVMNPSQMFMSRLALGISTPQLSGILVQQGAYLSVWDLSSGGALERTARLQQTGLEFLKPFDVFDQLTPLRAIQGCSVVALGVGLFVPSRRAPQPAVVLEVSEGNQYTATKLALELDPTFMLSSIFVAGAEYVGAVGVASTKPTATIFRRTGCHSFEFVAAAPMPVNPSWWTFPWNQATKQ